MSTEREKKDSLIALTLTAVIMVLIALFLLGARLTFYPPLTSDRTPAEMMLIEEEEEELFVEPELLELGEEKAVTHDAPAPSFKGQPAPAPEDHTELVVKDENPKPAPPVEKPITQKKESPVKATTPTATDKEKAKVTSSVAKGFAPRNGTETGKNSNSGAGGEGVGIQGSVRGRTFNGCPKPDVTLRHKTVVKVEVVVNEEGKVISASATGSADASIRRACEQAARQATWSAKKGAGDTHGSITFTITPR